MAQAEHLKPYQFKKGTTGNPYGRPRRNGKGIAKLKLPQRINTLGDVHAAQSAVWEAVTMGRLDIFTARELLKMLEQRANLMIKQASTEAKGDVDELQGHDFAEPELA